jgi:multidrug efflux pump subunit AcrA (membrane-fusion protein)
MTTYTRAIGVFVLAAGAAACGGSEQPAEARRLAPVPVAVAAAARRAVPEAIEVGGTVRAKQHAILTSRMVGQVREIRVLPGARVSRGQVLAVLDGREMDANRVRAAAMFSAATQGQTAAEAERDAADAALRLATATHARIARLKERNSATQQEFDEAEAALKAAQSRAAAAAANVAASRSNTEGARAAAEAAAVTSGYSRVTAPFDGVVTEKHIDPGVMAMPGTPILTVEQSGEPRVEVRLDESRAARVRWDVAPRVELDRPDGSTASVEGHVAERAHALDDAHTVVAKIAVGGEQVRTGMFARVVFAGASRERLVVPEDALVRRGQLDAVFVIDGDAARYRVVEAGERSRGVVEVRAGLVEGERVVVRPPASLTDGAAVAVRATR